MGNRGKVSRLRIKLYLYQDLEYAPGFWRDLTGISHPTTAARSNDRADILGVDPG